MRRRSTGSRDDGTRQLGGSAQKDGRQTGTRAKSGITRLEVITTANALFFPVVKVIVGNLILVGLKVTVIVSAFNGFSSHKEPEARWRRRVEVLAPLMACCCGVRRQTLVAEGEDPLAAVARALGVALRHVDFVPSDLAAALVLAGFQEREARALARISSVAWSLASICRNVAARLRDAHRR